jgi:hypothetical protein
LLVANLGVIVAVKVVSANVDVETVVCVEVVALTTCNMLPAGKRANGKVPELMFVALVALVACTLTSGNVKPFVPSIITVMVNP